MTKRQRKILLLMKRKKLEQQVGEDWFMLANSRAKSSRIFGRIPCVWHSIRTFLAFVPAKHR